MYNIIYYSTNTLFVKTTLYEDAHFLQCKWSNKFISIWFIILGARLTQSQQCFFDSFTMSSAGRLDAENHFMVISVLIDLNVKL